MSSRIVTAAVPPDTSYSMLSTLFPRTLLARSFTYRMPSGRLKRIPSWEAFHEQTKVDLAGLSDMLCLGQLIDWLNAFTWMLYEHQKRAHSFFAPNPRTMLKRLLPMLLESVNYHYGLSTDRELLSSYSLTWLEYYYKDIQSIRAQLLPDTLTDKIYLNDVLEKAIRYWASNLAQYNRVPYNLFTAIVADQIMMRIFSHQTINDMYVFSNS